MKIVAVLGLILLLAASPALALEKTGTTLPPDLSLPDGSGGKLNLAELCRDKTTVLVFWSVSCPHCRREMPGLLEINRKLTGNPFIMLMINTDGPAMSRAALGYARKYKLPAPLLLDQGPEDSAPLSEAFDVIATPTVLVLDKSGKLVHAQEVKVDMKKLMRAVEAAF